METWQKAITEEWNKRSAAQSHGENKFPLIDQTFDANEILSVIETVMSGQLTMSTKVREFEKQFAQYIGAPFAVMVNSGSSANLLAVAAATNFMRKNSLKPGDEILIPAVCWSTSLWPLIQCQLKPVFVDVDPKSLNLDIRELEKKTTKKTKGILAVHILGNSAPMEALLGWAKTRDLIVIEDTCESLGSTYQGKKLGALGDFGTYSFYYSHHMTTGEGGMVICKTQEDYDLLKCLRAHGWSRELSNKAELEAQNPQVDPRFLFVNVGYNLRPMEIQAALGICQLAKLNRMNETRVKNRESIIKALTKHSKWQGQFEFIEASPSTEPVWFGFCALLRSDLQKNKTQFLQKLGERGIENRPIVSGNFVRQPALKHLGYELRPEDFPGAESIEKRGFFVGLHTNPLEQKQIDYLVESLLQTSDPI